MHYSYLQFRICYAGNLKKMDGLLWQQGPSNKNNITHHFLKVFGQIQRLEISRESSSLLLCEGPLNKTKWEEAIG